MFELALRQSDLKTLDMCPHRWVWERDNPDEKWETSPAAIGSAVHAGIEAYLTLPGMSRLECLDVIYMDFMYRTQLDNFKWVKVMTAETALRHAERYFGHWWAKYADHYDLNRPRPELVEYTFKNVPLYEDDEYKITVNGTVDLIDDWVESDDSGEWECRKPIDWKTSSRGEYPVWEYARWAVQPTVYTYALRHEFPGVVWSDFTYGVMHADGVQDFSVVRGPSDWAWLQQKALSYAKMIESGTAPKQDNHALCSEKWCAAWAQCKGASAPVAISFDRC
jgi:hypothetical protein